MDTYIYGIILVYFVWVLNQDTCKSYIIISDIICNL